MTAPKIPSGQTYLLKQPPGRGVLSGGSPEYEIVSARLGSAVDSGPGAGQEPAAALLRQLAILENHGPA